MQRLERTKSSQRTDAALREHTEFTENRCSAEKEHRVHREQMQR
jgi:hypothetical protein